MSKVIAFFNHKGGVSKTTTTFNLGWAIAETGRKVVIVDGDPQCNLTGMVLGFQGDQDFAEFYRRRPRANLSGCLQPVFSGSQRPLEPADLVETGHPNLMLLAGHIDFAESETQLSVALSAGRAIPALLNLPGALRRLVDISADAAEADVVLLDLSPSVGATNECFLFGSDYFIVPTSPDYFCDQAIRSLAKVLPRWNREIDPFRDTSLEYSFPATPPVFIGTLSQRYRPRSGDPSASFQDWIDRIKETTNRTLVPALQPLEMVVSEAHFRRYATVDTPYNLANIADFNSLIAQSQKHQTPVFALSDTQIERVGVVLDTMRTSRDNFRTTFEKLAASVTALARI